MKNKMEVSDFVQSLPQLRPFKIAHNHDFHPPELWRLEPSQTDLLVNQFLPIIKTDFSFPCDACPNLHRTRRHKPFGNLQPISSPSMPFHHICIDFILALPQADGFDCVMSVTDKFSKRITLIPGAANFGASKWADLLLDRLRLADWGIPKAMNAFIRISFRHPRAIDAPVFGAPPLVFSAFVASPLIYPQLTRAQHFSLFGAYLIEKVDYWWN